MKAKKFLAAVIAVIMLFTMLPLTASAETDPAATPITNQQELAAMDLDGNYYLANDIELTGNWTPIGHAGNEKPTAFSGTFDGNGHKITGLNINLPSSSGYSGQYIGLFASNNGTIKNLTVENGAVKGYKGVGTIVGINHGMVENCAVVGGDVIGTQVTSSVNALYSSGNYIGGITGQNGSDGTITGCSSSAYVEGVRWIGGLAGANFGLIEKSSVVNAGINTNLVDPNWANNAAIVLLQTNRFVYSSAGGLAGENQGNISNCYAVGTILKGWDYTGGLVGMMEQTSGTVTNCYCAEGGIMGYPDGYIYGNYTLTPDALDYTIGSYSRANQISGVYCTANSYKIPASGTSYTTNSGMLKQQSTYKEYDFDTVWTMEGSESNNGYPVLRPSVDEEPVDPILSVTALDLEEETEITSIHSRERFRVRVVTDATVEALTQQNENGLVLLNKDMTCNENPDGTLTWEYITSVYTIGEQRTISIIPTVDGEEVASEGKYVLDVLANAPVVTEAYFTDAQVERNEEVNLTVKTNIDTARLEIYNEYGVKMQIIDSSYEDEGETRVWTCTIKIGTAGKGRQYYVSGKNIVGESGEKVATNTIDVVIAANAPVVTKAYFTDAQVERNEEVNLTVETNVDTVKLEIYNEYGLKMQIIDSSYEDEGETRVWTCTIKIGTAGTGRMYYVSGKNIVGESSEQVTTNTIDVVLPSA